MIRDLLGAGVVDDSPDFVVIGAGTVGLPTATLLALKTGRRVVCLESGTADPAATNVLNEVVQLASVYAGAAEGRFRGLGGTSTRWGGALIPFQAADLSTAGWPISIEDLTPYLADVEALFGLEPGPYSDPSFPVALGVNHVNRLAKWPPFRKRNVFNLLGKDVKGSTNLSVWINATVTKIQPEPSGAVFLTARSDAGDCLSIVTHRLIIAAGAIETTRQALRLDQWAFERGATPNRVVGRGFSDHISAKVAEIRPKDVTRLNRIIGFRFAKDGGMRNIRFELAPDAPARREAPPSFAHIGFEVTHTGGFDALRELFRWLQMRRLPPVSVGLDLARYSPWLARAVYWRYANKRLLFPAHARIVAHMVTEQVPVDDNYIGLSQSRTDQFGVPLPEINWRITESDLDNVSHSVDVFEETWNACGLRAYGSLERYPKDVVAASVSQTGGIFHPTGSTRMGRSAETGVVDRDLRLFSAPSIQLLSTSVLPTGGGANPTMMLLLLAMRCVDQYASS